MSRKVLLVDGDLLALSRVEAATRAAGAELTTCAGAELGNKLLEQDFDLVLVDLDRGGRAALQARGSNEKGRVVGFYSHVDDDLKRAAVAAGIDAWPRGRLWRSLGDLLSL